MTPCKLKSREESDNCGYDDARGMPRDTLADELPSRLSASCAQRRPPCRTHEKADSSCIDRSNIPVSSVREDPSEPRLLCIPRGGLKTFRADVGARARVADNAGGGG
jgi:hypothetical protein